MGVVDALWKTQYQSLTCLDGEYQIRCNFVETPRKFIIAKLSIRNLGSLSMVIIMKIRAYGSKALR